MADCLASSVDRATALVYGHRGARTHFMSDAARGSVSGGCALQAQVTSANCVSPHGDSGERSMTGRGPGVGCERTPSRLLDADARVIDCQHRSCLLGRAPRLDCRRQASYEAGGVSHSVLGPASAGTGQRRRAKGVPRRSSRRNRTETCARVGW